MNPIIKKILDILLSSGKLPENHTGKVQLEINMNEGGVRDATLTVPEKLK